MAVTIKDLAMLTGISRQAVSAVLGGNSHSRVSPQTRAKILQLAKDLNYIPNSAARSLNGIKPHAIGILANTLPSISGIYLYEICQLLNSFGYHAFIGHYNPFNYSPESSLTEMVSHGVEGMIIMNSEVCTESLVRQTVPCVFCLHETPTFDITVDNELTGYLGTRHLLEHGHERVYYIRIHPFAPEASPRHLQRLEGWRRAHHERGIEVTEDMIIYLNQLQGLGSRLIQYLREKHVTALYATNDHVALRVMKCLLDHGIRIPEDIAIVGCDGYSFTECAPVSLATVIQPIHSVAEQTVRLMLERIRNNILNAPPANIRVSPLFHPGRSCGCSSRPVEELYQINTLGFLESDYLNNFNHNIQDDCI